MLCLKGEQVAQSRHCREIGEIWVYLSAFESLMSTFVICISKVGRSCLLLGLEGEGYCDSCLGVSFYMHPLNVNTN